MATSSGLFESIFATFGQLTGQALANQAANDRAHLALDLATIDRDATATAGDYAVAVAKARADYQSRVAQQAAAQSRQQVIITGVVGATLILGAALLVLALHRPPTPTVYGN